MAVYYLCYAQLEQGVPAVSDVDDEEIPIFSKTPGYRYCCCSLGDLSEDILRQVEREIMEYAIGERLIPSPADRDNLADAEGYVAWLEVRSRDEWVRNKPGLVAVYEPVRQFETLWQADRVGGGKVNALLSMAKRRAQTLIGAHGNPLALPPQREVPTRPAPDTEQQRKERMACELWLEGLTLNEIADRLKEAFGKSPGVDAIRNWAESHWNREHPDEPFPKRKAGRHKGK